MKTNLKNILLAYLILFGGLLSTSCSKHKVVQTTMDFFLKATTGPMKDVGTAD